MKDKPLLFFLHGIGANHRSFQPLLRQLKDLNTTFELVAFDFWGFGDTVVPQSVGKASISALAEQTAHEIFRCNPDKTRSIHIVGHSMGGAVTVEMHRLFPELKVDSFLNLEGILRPEDCVYWRELSEQGRETFCGSGFEKVKREIRLHASQGSISSQDWIFGLEKTTAEVFFDACVDLVRVSAYLYPIYRSWETRSVYVFGEKTLERSPGAKSTYQQLSKDGKSTAIIPNSGHVLQVEQPQAVAELCRRHLQAIGTLFCT